MRYSIMVQIVVGMTLLLVVGGAFFAWLQNRPVDDPISSLAGWPDTPLDSGSWH